MADEQHGGLRMAYDEKEAARILPKRPPLDVRMDRLVQEALDQFAHDTPPASR